MSGGVYECVLVCTVPNGEHEKREGMARAEILHEHTLMKAKGRNDGAAAKAESG